ncbi:MAG: hypothetical protein MUC97_00745 [Bernardetiaceae bacterium]|jgi:hypothetical protein|nr:hypothetical protein [Bernardetiaceae bacterium]
MINSKVFVNRDQANDLIVYQSDWMKVSFLQAEFWIDVTWFASNLELPSDDFVREKLTYVLSTKGYASAKINWVLVNALHLRPLAAVPLPNIRDFFSDLCTVPGVRKYAVLLSPDFGGLTSFSQKGLVHLFDDDAQARHWLKTP